MISPHREGKADPSAAEIQDRLFLPMLTEATRILEEGIARSPADLEMGLVLGIGFPAFRGGILHWADDLGAAEVTRRLEKHAPLGERFRLTWLLAKWAAGGGPLAE